MAGRKFPRIDEEEMFSAGIDFLIYAFLVAFLAAIGFFYALNIPDEILRMFCLVCNWSFIAIAAIGLQYKLIADSVAAGMVMFEEQKKSQENQESDIDQITARDEEEDSPQHEELDESNIENEHIRSWKRMHKSKLEEKIFNITEELKILKPMFNLAVSTQDETTKDNLRPRIESLLKNLNNLRAELSHLEEE